MPRLLKGAKNIGRYTRETKLVRERRLRRKIEEHLADNAKTRERATRARANETSEQRNQRLRANALRQREARQRTTNEHRERNRRRMQVYRALKRESLNRLEFEYDPEIDNSKEMFQNENNSKANGDKPTDTTELKVPKLEPVHSEYLIPDIRDDFSESPFVSLSKADDGEQPTDTTEFIVPKLEQFHTEYIIPDDFSESPSISMSKDSLQTRLATLYGELEELRQRRQQQEIEIVNIDNKRQRFQEVLDNLSTQEMQKVQEIQHLEMEYT